MTLQVDDSDPEIETFKNVDSWISMIHDKAKDNVLVALVGNKVDMEAKRYFFDEQNRHSKPRYREGIKV